MLLVGLGSLAGGAAVGREGGRHLGGGLGDSLWGGGVVWKKWRLGNKGLLRSDLSS